LMDTHAIARGGLGGRGVLEAARGHVMSIVLP
jgi:hypothetical protein